LSFLSLPVATSIIDLRVVKRPRSIRDGDISHHDAKRPKRRDIREQARPRLGNCRDKFIKGWLSTSSWSRRTSADNKNLLQEVSDNMSRKPAEGLASPGDSFSSIASSLRKLERSAASVHDIDYHQSLRYRNIYIEREDPLVELMRRAERIISRPRASLEMDDIAAKRLKDKARRLRNNGEKDIVQQLAPHIIPAIDDVPDQRLARNADQP
jgi:hypothetical protein